MRIVELATSGCIMVLSAYFMWHATVLPIGWQPGSGPGGGAFPFWLSLGMFLCAAAVFVRAALMPMTPAQIRRVFVHPQASGQMAVMTGGTLATVALMPVLGAYIVLPLFIIGYTKYIGRSSWLLSLSLAVGTILFCFFFFEVALKILLPKGITEPLFFPLYAMFF
jgi:putative tricarboxylic transport membrane protein